MTNPNERTENLIVVRESAVYDRALMQGMLEATLSKAQNVPGVEEMRAIGINAILDPVRYGGIVIRTGKSKAVRFERQGTVFLFSEGSAAAQDMDGDNAFVTLLSRAIEELRPAHIWTATFSRLIRSTMALGPLIKAVSSVKPNIHADVEVDLSTKEGEMMWVVFSMMASMERDAIVQRLQIGSMHYFHKTGWYPGIVFPPGYMFDSKKRLAVDVESVPTVRAMLKLLADDTLTARQICDRLGALGLSRPGIRRFHTAQGTFADVANPGSALASLTRWVELYASGTHTFRQKNNFQKVEYLLEHRVIRNERESESYIELTTSAPLPAGGWASPEVFESIRRRTARVPAPLKGGRGHSRLKPLSATWSWSDDTYQYTVLCRGNKYKVYRRPFSDTPDAGWYVNRDSSIENLATVRSADLHAAIATAAASAVRDGIPAHLVEGEMLWLEEGLSFPRIDSTSAELLALKRQLEEAETLAKRARKNATLASNPATSQAFISDADDYEYTAGTLKARVAELEQRAQPQLEPSFTTNAALVARALANLATVDDVAERPVRSAVDQIIKGHYITVEDSTVTFAFSLRVPVSQGVAALGPITCSLPDRRKTNNDQPTRPFPPEMTRLALMVLSSHPDTQVHEMVLTAATDGATHNDAYIQHMVAVYTSADFQWSSRGWRLDDRERQSLVDIVARLGGRALPNAVRTEGIERNRMWRFSRGEDAVLRRSGTWRKGLNDGTRMLSLVPCPHCDGHATVVIRVPEVPGSLLCPTCRRMPTPNSPVFPPTYFPADRP